MTRKSLYEQTTYILENFDFDKVHRVMTFLDWHWASVGGVPSIEELKKCAAYVMHEAAAGLDGEYARKGHDHFVGTGGFTAHVYRWNNGDCMELKFDVANYSGNLA